ncbi:DUF4328 domain-containing protein [Streptomyces sp. NPDC007172]|uniref:DUF4328 domain-containing protein n=1 Tax=Streptomyces sp. NPDC007172 TaxID=3364776 RepID=UPI0036AC3A94
MSGSSRRSGEDEGDDWAKGFETYAGLDTLGLPRAAGAGGAHRFRPLRGLALTVGVLLLLAAAAAVHGLFVDVDAFRLSGLSTPGGHTAAPNGLDAAVDREGPASSLQLWAMAATAGFFIAWFHRTRTNAEVLDPGSCSTGPGWAIGVWFVPLVNLVMPWLIARDVTRASVRPAPAHTGRGAPFALLNAWWLAWVASKVLALIGSRLPAAGADVAAAHRGAGVMIAIDVLNLAAAVLAILYVRQLTYRQERASAGATG